MEKEPLIPSHLKIPITPNEIPIPVYEDTLIFDFPKSSSQTLDALNPTMDIDNSSDSLKPFDSNVGSNSIPVIDPDLEIQIPHSGSKTTINEFDDQPSNATSQQLASSSITRQWIVLFIMYLSLGAVIYCSRENFIDSDTHVAVDDDAL